MSTKPEGTAPNRASRSPVIRTGLEGNSAVPSVNLARAIPLWILSGVLHVVFFLMFWYILPSANGDGTTIDVPEEDKTVTQVEDTAKDLDLTNPEMGNDPEVATNYDVDRLAAESVPGIVVPGEAIGIPGAPEGPAVTVPPPPGLGQGTGAGVAGDFSGLGETTSGLPGGWGGQMKYWPGGFGGRSAGTREKIAQEGGGSAESEARVALGLQWLARHQCGNGCWSLDKFNQFARDKPTLTGKTFTCSCSGAGLSNDTAGTAFGVLPFLGAGITHRKNPQMKNDELCNLYSRNVDAALHYLMEHQKPKDGEFPGGMYAHGLATIAMCEAYGMTSDPALKMSAQKAINYIVAAQNPGSGGWRYTPRSGDSDTSVLGWQVMALKSGEMAGLAVPEATLQGARKWLDTCQTPDGGGYGYMDNRDTPTMTAVGLLCREYLGWSPRNPGLMAGVARLKKTPPGAMESMYYYYYATQVMHHMGGDSWKEWNLKMRDSLMAKQDNGRLPKFQHQKGSWSPKADTHGDTGGRIMQTSLSLLTLEVYYRHLPLYRSDLGTGRTNKEE